MPTYKDLAGNTVQTSDNKPPVAGATVKVNTGSGQASATMVGGYAVKNK